MVPSLKTKPELTPGLDALKELVVKEVEPAIKEKFSIVLEADIEELVKKLNNETVGLGQLGSFAIKPVNVLVRKDGKVDVE